MSNELAIQQSSEGMFTKYQREAKLLLNSSFLPERFNNSNISTERRIADICVAMDIAMQFPMFRPLQVMQQIYFISGQPAWKSSFIISLLKSQGLRLTFEEVGDWETNDAKTRCVATEKDGTKHYGTWITKDIVHKEGWDRKPGSKWLSMPAQMARYRAATFLARSDWPELLMGYYTTDECADFTKGNTPSECYEPAYEAEIIPPQPQVTIIDNGPTEEDLDEAAERIMGK